MGALRYRDPETGATVPAQTAPWLAPSGVPYELAGPGPVFRPDDIAVHRVGLWRYAHVLPALPDELIERASMGEGMTPLVRGDATLHFKIEYAAPTLSFKDRGAVVMLAQAAAWGVTEVAVDSSGNAGCAVAAYSARLGLRAHVFLPADTAARKRQQIEAYGATVHVVSGARAAAADAARDFVQDNDVFYASHVYCPLFSEGTKTYLFELWEQLGGHLPERLYLPVGNGTLLLGAALALDELERAGVLSHRPLIIAVQAEACAPLAAAYAEGRIALKGDFKAGTTAAAGIAIAAPPRARQLLTLMRRLGGRFVTVSEAALHAARERLASQGFDVEATAAASYAGYLQDAPSAASAVVPLCGAGLKDRD